jgi:hypothetical protein
MRPMRRDPPTRETVERWRMWDEQAQQRRRTDAIAAQPGGRARLLRKLFLDREREVRARAEATTDEGERAWLTANADDLRRAANDVEDEAKEFDAMQTAQQIIENAQKRLRDIGQRYAAVREDDDKKHPPSDQAWRSQHRALLRREWQNDVSQTYAVATEWRNAERQRNLALYAQDPVGDAAAETRRLRLEQETAALAAQFMGQRVQAKNRLLPQAGEALAAGNVERAQVVLNAAKRIGLEDARLEHAIKTTLDQTVPHRKAALQGLGRIEQTVDGLRLAIVTERQAAGIGTSSEQVRDSSYRKMIEWRREQGLILVDGGSGAPSGEAAGPTAGGATSE